MQITLTATKLLNDDVANMLRNTQNALDQLLDTWYRIDDNDKATIIKRLAGWECILCNKNIPYGIPACDECNRFVDNLYKNK